MVLWALADFNTTPDISAGPGGGAIQTLISYTAGLAVAFCVFSWLGGGAAIAIGAHGDNYRASAFGKRALVTAALGSFVVGAAGALNHFFLHIGQVFS